MVVIKYMGIDIRLDYLELNLEESLEHGINMCWVAYPVK